MLPYNEDPHALAMLDVLGIEHLPQLEQTGHAVLGQLRDHGALTLEDLVDSTCLDPDAVHAALVWARDRAGLVEERAGAWRLI